MNRPTARWRPAVVTALSLPLLLALSGTASAAEPTVDLPAQASDQALISTTKHDRAPAEQQAVTADPVVAVAVMGPQPLSSADAGGSGANPGGTAGGSCTAADPTNAYCSTRNGSPSLNGAGDGTATGQPCAGCVGRADNKNPPGQAPNGGDANAGYECDRNSGVGRTNPAHTGCRSTPPTTTRTVVPPPGTTPPGTTPPGTTPPGTTPPGTTLGGGTPSQPVLGPPVTIVPNTAVPPTALPPVGPPTSVPPVLRPPVQAAPETLPFTGPRLTATLPLAGLLMLAGGAVLLVAGRRRTA